MTDGEPSDAVPGEVGGLGGEWLRVPAASTPPPADPETVSLSSAAASVAGRRSARSALETSAGYDSDDDDDGEYTSGSSEGGDFDLSDHAAPTVADHIAGRTTLLAWRPRERTRCLVLASVLLAAAALFALRERGYLGPTPSLRRPPGAVGVGHASYDAVRSGRLDEYAATLTLYRHRATGAEFLAYVPDGTRRGPSSGTGTSGRGGEGGGGSGGGYDPKPDKVFGVSFRTRPESSTGVPHVLEHSVLCGSRKYPSRDPFAHLLKGSLQTFLNAMTYPDRTVYPVASRNRADFRNLMDVYLDAVFHPRAVEEEGWWVLRQEGWRYDVVGGDDDGDEADGGVSLPGERRDFEYKGVVYSEMKGAYSDPEGLMDRVAQGLLFPDSPYRYDSGGDPAVIPTLTREEFVGFHRRYYHPTNARLFVAGDESDVYDALSRASAYMTPFGYNPQSRKESVIPYQQRTFKKPVYERRPYSAPGGDGGGGGGGHMLQVTWLLNTQPLDGVTELAWIVLDHLLLGRPSSPLRKALEDSGLGEETIGGGLDDELSQSTFAIGMRGVGSRRDVSRLEDLIMDTLAGLDSGGFTDDEIDSTMNTIEFRLREGGGGLRGMEVFLGSLTKWNYDLDPRDALVYEDSLAGLRGEVDRTGSNVFQRLIRDALIGNSHRVVLELYPSATYEDELAQDTRAQLARSQSRMTDDEYGSVVEEGKRLKELQGTEESPEVLATNPALSISDIDTLPIEYPVKVEANAFKSGIVAVSHEVESSGIAYVDFGMDISMVPFEDAALLPSLITVLNEAGTSDMDATDFRNYIGKVTGGVSASLEIMSVKPTGWEDDNRVLPGTNMRTMLFLNGKCTAERIPELFDVFTRILTDVNMDDAQDIVRNALKSNLSSKKSSIASRGHSFADRRIRGRYSVRNYISEKIYGVSSIRSYDSVLESLDGDWDQFALLVRGVLRKILDGSREGMVLNLTGDEAVLDAATEHAEEFLTNGLPLDLGRTPDVTPDFRSSPHPWMVSAEREMEEADPVRDEFISVSTQVAYTAEGGRLYGPGDEVSGSTSVVSHYLTTGYMWDVIRAKNGAYGAYSSFARTDGVATLYTYRDPNSPEDTLSLFADAADSILRDSESGALSRDDNAAITTAVIGTVGSLDGSALSARDAGWVALTRYLRGESPISRQKWRNAVLATSEEDFVDFARRLKHWKEFSIAVVASQSAFDDLEREMFLIKT